MHPLNRCGTPRQPSLPTTRQTIEVIRIDDESRTLETRERGGLIRSWNHTITVTPHGDCSCQYTDRTEIDAGTVTPVVAAYARWMYRVRQSRWAQLAHVLPRTNAG